MQCEYSAFTDMGCSDMMADCANRIDSWDNTMGTAEAPDQYYYTRGFGVLPLQGSEEYSEFSKAVFGDETILTNNPNELFTFSDGDGFQILPVAVLLWRYFQMYHSGLPSAHDVVTGMWSPTTEEAAAGLTSPHDFCTLVAQI